MALNKYFIIKKPEQAIDSILKHTVERGISNTRISNDRNFVIVKLPIGASIPPSMQNLSSYTNSEILNILNSDPNWIAPDII